MRRACVIALALAVAAAGDGAAVAKKRHHRTYHGPAKVKSLFPSMHIVVPNQSGQSDPAPPSQDPAAPPSQQQPAPTWPSRTGVDEGEYWVYPAHNTLAAGPVELNPHNYGQDDHDFTLADGNGTILAQVYLTPGQTQQVDLTLAAGTYRLYCSLYNGAHAQQGMDTKLKVV